MSTTAIKRARVDDAPPAVQVPQEVIVQFCDAAGEEVGPELSLKSDVTRSQLLSFLKQLDLDTSEDENERNLFTFVIHDSIGESATVETDITSALTNLPHFSAEATLKVHFYPISNFRVRPVTRCTSSLKAHTGPVTCVAFNARSTLLATGGGDNAVRVWDSSTETPVKQFRGHTQHVRELAWSPFGNLLASAGVDAVVRVWRVESDEQLGEVSNEPFLLKRHKRPVTCLMWQPLHHMDDANEQQKQNVPYLASGALDGQIIIWDVVLRLPLHILSGHVKMISCLRFSGQNCSTLLSVSRDTTVLVWNWRTGEQKAKRAQHASWINQLSLNTDFHLHAGGFDHAKTASSLQEARKSSAEKFDAFFRRNCGGRELAVTCSDDNTLYLWATAESEKSIARMTGHQDVVVDCKFSPDGRYIASASFDRSVRLWDGSSGKFIATLRGHVGHVYRLCWSPDSRLIASAGGDALVKVWSVSTKKSAVSLDAHGDAVYAIEWSRDGKRVATGSKDSYVKFWRF